MPEWKDVVIRTRGKLIETPCGTIIHGLEDVYVAETKLSKVDGENGRLWFRGYRIEDLAEHASFEEVLFLFLEGRLPTRSELEEYRSSILSQMSIGEELAQVAKATSRGHPMFVLEAGIAAMGAMDPRAQDQSPEANRMKALRIIAKMPTLIAYHYRYRQGLNPVPPREDYGYAKNFLYMMLGREPDELESRAIELYLVLHADHGTPASTFTAMVIGSTLSDLYSAVAGAVAALKGPLHGGANEAALRQYKEVGDPGRAREFVERSLAQKRRIMGVGHRVYKAYDPRARIYKEFTRRFVEAKGDPENLFAVAEAIERAVLEHEYFRERRIYPNIDFWSGIAMYYIGIPPEYFTTIFAISRTVGWIAHVMEYWQVNRIFRPRACYTGPLDLEYVPLDKRG